LQQVAHLTSNLSWVQFPSKVPKKCYLEQEIGQQKMGSDVL